MRTIERIYCDFCHTLFGEQEEIQADDKTGKKYHAGECYKKGKAMRANYIRIKTLAEGTPP